MAGLKFYSNAQAFSTTLNVPEPAATTETTDASGGVLYKWNELR